MSGPARGQSAALMRVAVCKDCQREIERLRVELADARARGNDKEIARLTAAIDAKRGGEFTYSEYSANGVLDRGGSRSDRCAEHRKKHRTNTQGMAVAFVDLETVGVAEGADSPEGPTGPFGGLGPMPGGHEPDPRGADLAEYEFGMTDKDIVEILEVLRHKRVLILKAGTGTGKSTFGPFRLMDPPTMEDLARLGILDELAHPTAEELAEGKMPIVLPPEGPYRLTSLGPIVVTEPRVAAATGVSQFVGEKLAMGCKLKYCSKHGHFNPKAHSDDPEGPAGPACPDLKHEDEARRCQRDHVGDHPGGPKQKGCEVNDCFDHIGPGFPVGSHAAGIRNWDDACQLVYATDGAVINWLRDGRLSRIGTVIVDEAHERSVNIDFIMGYLRRDLDKYPHLRVIITSATFDTNFYLEYFGEDIAEVKDVPAVKTVGYGMPLFPELDANTDEMKAFLAAHPANTWTEQADWPLHEGTDVDERDRHRRFVETHWRTRLAPKLKDTEVADPKDVDYQEDLHKTTLKLLDLRQDLSKVPPTGPGGIIDEQAWKVQAPDELAQFVINLANGLDEHDIYGDILGFLPTARTIKETCDKIRSALGPRADVCELVSSLKQDEIDRALSARRKGDKRKIVISTNLAETSLTVEGVRFVVDTGLIAQSDWNPELASGGVGTTLHSRAGIKQRWGRVGRKAPGWVFPLYTKAQYATLSADTPPGSTRENLEALMMTARLGGVDDVKAFPWPAAFKPQRLTKLDASGEAAYETFIRERDRADEALRASGAVNEHGHPTSFGKELNRFSSVGSTGGAMAIMYADRLACVPEVLTILGTLEDARLIGASQLFHDDRGWPEEWRVEAYRRHRALADLAEDDAHLALLVTAAWERSDPETPTWEHSVKRRDWCLQWWLNHDVLLELAQKRKDVLQTLSPGMKKPVKRHLELALLDRARAVLARTMGSLEYRLRDGAYWPVVVPPGVNGTITPRPFQIEDDILTAGRPERILAFRRREDRAGDGRVSNLMTLPAETGGPANPAASEADAMRLVRTVARTAPPNPARNAALAVLDTWPVGRRLLLTADAAADLSAIRPETADGFARPRTAEEAEKDGLGRSLPTRWKQRRDDDGTPARSDSTTELPVKVNGGVDEDKLAKREREAAGRLLDQAPCGLCEECRKGRTERCARPSERYEEAGDVTSTWRDATSDARRRTLAAIHLAFVDSEPSDQPVWYEVIGYADGEVRLAKDWRDPEDDPDPTTHTGAYLGEQLTVEVGEKLRHHGGEVRAFRPVGRPGRFLLREATPTPRQIEFGEIAASLDSTYQGLLADLVEGQRLPATAVPGRADGAVTITFLEVLHNHLQQAEGVFKPLDAADPKSARERFHPAVVESDPDDFGRQTIRLLHHDSISGVRHRFRVAAAGRAADDDDGPEQADAATPAGRPTGPLAPKHPIALRLDLAWRQRKHLGRLPVAGLDLDALEAIRQGSDGGIKLSIPKETGATDPADVADACADDLEGVAARPAPPGTQLELAWKKSRPLSSAAAEALAELDPSPEWVRRVWAFWARSHHYTLHREVGFVDHDDTEDKDCPLPNSIRRQDDRTARQGRLQDFADLHRTGAVFDVTVETFEPGTNATIVKLPGGGEGCIEIQELSWAWVADPSEVVRKGEVLRVVLLDDVDPARHPRARVSAKQLLPDPYVELRQQVAVGDVIRGVVDRATDTHVYVRFPNGASGAVYHKNLRWWPPVNNPQDDYKSGDVIRAKIINFDDDRRQVELSAKALLPDPYAEWRERPEALGDAVNVSVDRVTKTHVYVSLPNGAPGVVFFRNLSWEPVSDAREHCKPGDPATAEIIKFDDERRQVELSIKKLQPDPAKAAFDDFKSSNGVGPTVRGTVTKILPKRAFVDLGDRVRGSIFIRDVTGRPLESFDGYLREGEQYDFSITGYDRDRTQVNLARPRLAQQPATPSRPSSAPRREAAQPVRAAVRPRPQPRSATGEGATVEDAIANACRALGLSVRHVKVELLDPGERSGLFRRTRRQAKVRVTERL